MNFAINTSFCLCVDNNWCYILSVLKESILYSEVSFSTDFKRRCSKWMSEDFRDFHEPSLNSIVSICKKSIKWRWVFLCIIYCTNDNNGGEIPCLLIPNPPNWSDPLKRWKINCLGKDGWRGTHSRSTHFKGTRPSDLLSEGFCRYRLRVLYAYTMKCVVFIKRLHYFHS